MLLGRVDSFDGLDLKSGREEEEKRERLLIGAAFENATLRGAARGGCVEAGLGLHAELSLECSFDEGSLADR